MALNLNALAKRVTEAEGGAVSLPIGQVKEVVRLVLTELSLVPASEVLATIERHRENDYRRGQPPAGAGA